ncbi:MAG TPA: aminotransferase class I/II-fold pyridoxal phosphate-dependent enzyme [Vicinamibacterales bacterium]|nr:aminotransferase class I/II-fold pyridoxal phosphate-dependent enzyme [Vicinamibacterales bacterium]
MLTAISRYGARVLPNTEQIIAGCRRRGTLIQGPQIEEFEAAFAGRVAGAHVVPASYGRMAFLYILKALDLPPGSEIIVPALTFWVIPALARAAGLTVVFADVDPATFTLDPDAFERAITARTRAVVPTHLYGLPCDMDRIMAIAGRHGLAVIEDCAHALGATYRGRPVGTFGDAGFFSFQTLKPLNCYGGGMAVLRDADVARRVREAAAAEPWPDEQRVLKRLFVGKLQRIFIRPWVFTISSFPILWAASWFEANPDVYLWEKIRSLDPLPAGYTERFPNVQAAIGLEALKYLDDWTSRTQAHARQMNEALAGLPGVTVPVVPPDRTHVYYQYCVYGPDRDRLVVRCVRHGIDIETLHVDVCSDLDLFADANAPAPGAGRASQAMQIPVYATLTDAQMRRIAQVVRRVLAGSSGRSASPGS